MHLLELRIGVPPFLSCIHIGRTLIIGVSQHGDHCKFTMRLTKTAKKMTWDENCLHSVNGQPPLTSLLIAEPVITWQPTLLLINVDSAMWKAWNSLNFHWLNHQNDDKTFQYICPTWLVEDGNADLSLLVNVGVPHFSQDPRVEIWKYF